MQRIRSVGNFLRDFWNMWGAHMSGAFSVPFGAAAVFTDSKYGRLVWAVMAYGALGLSAILFYLRAIRSENKQKPILRAKYDSKIPSCDAIVSSVDGSQSRCIRLEVRNAGTIRLNRCEGWLQSISEFPGLSPAKLFWAGIPEEGVVDLTKDIPRFLQVFRIHHWNRIIPAT